MKLNIKKGMSGIALSMLCLSAASYADTAVKAPTAATPLAPFTSFDLAAAVTGYIVQGTLYSAAGATAGTMVIDTPNNRVAFIFPPLGNFITTTTDSFNYNLGGNPACFQYAGFGYTALKDSFDLITSTPGATTKQGRFTGYTKDSFSCNQNITFSFLQTEVNVKGTKFPVIAELDAALPSPNFAAGTCNQGQAYFVSDLKTVDITSNRDSYFVLPPACSTPIPYCQTAYPPGNPCAIDCVTTPSGKKSCTTKKA